MGPFGSAEGPRQWGPKGAKGGTVKRKAAGAASAGSGGTAGAAASGTCPAPKRARQQVNLHCCH